MKGNVYPEIVLLKIKAASFATRNYVKRKRSVVPFKGNKLKVLKMKYLRFIIKELLEGKQHPM